MWTHPESPVGQKTEDESSNDEAAADAEAESDSGDSLFITQTAVPEAVRAGRRHRRRQPDSTSSSSESDATLSSSHRKSKKFTMDKETRIKYKKKPLSKSRLPTYSFPFLEGSLQMSRSSMLPVQQNTRLHNSLMGGFFECVREQWQGFLLTSFATSSLPTVDKEGQYIHPLTEDEEERSEDEDFKVVPKKCFVASTKAKRKQTWCNQVKEQSGRRRKAVKARQKTSQKGQRKVLPAKASTSWAASLSSDTESDDDEDFSCGVLDETERIDEHVTNDKNCLNQTATPRTNRYLARTARKELCIDSDSTGRELQRSPTASDSQTDVSHTDDLSQTEDEPESTDNDNVCDESTVKEREKDSESVNEEVEETFSLAQDNWAEPSALQATDEVEFNERNYAENLSLDDAILIQEEGDTRESIESDVRMEDDGKKRKRSREGDEDVEQLESSADTEPRNLHGNAEIQKKRKKEIVLPEGCEEEEASNRILDMTPASTGQSEKSGDNPAASEETLESSYSRRTKHQKKQQSSSNGATHDGDDGEDVNFSNGAVTSAESTEESLTKKKKKKTVSDAQDISDTSVANEMFENLDNTQETTEGPEDENAELMMMKKKTVSDVVDASYTSEENKKLKHVDDTQKAMEGLDDQNAELETPRKRRKKKKKSTVSEGKDISHTLEENENIGDVGNIQKATGSRKDQNPEPETPKEKKKKKKTVSDEVDSCYTSEENKKLKHVDDTQTAIEDFKDQNTELETPRKRKKKKKSTVSDGEDFSHTLEENEINDDVGNIQKATESPKDQNAELETHKKKKKKTKTVADEVDNSSTYEEIEKVDDTQKTSEAPEDENAELQTPKKKKKKKKKTVSDEIDISYTLEENENIRDVDNTQKTTKSVEDENADLVTMKKKKKKKIVSDEVEPSYTSEENEKLKDVDNIQKMVEGLEEQNAELETAKKKKKKKTVSSEVEICHTSQENEMVENVDATHKTTEGLEDQSNELVTLKKKKRKKKALSDEVQDIDNTQKTTKGLDDQNAELVAMKKKKKKTVSNGEDISYTLEENEKVDDTQKGTDGPEDQNAELVTTEKKKKKKKIGEITSRNISEDSAAQSDDSVSVQKKEKKRTSSFLVADAEENVQTYRGQKSPAQSVDAHVWSAQKPGVSAGETESAEITGCLEETNDGVRKKKRKRKTSVEQDSVEKDHKQDFEEPNKACLHETTNTGVKRKKKLTGNESETVTPMERLENAADEEHRPTDEAAMLKRKKKKKCKDKPCHMIEDNPPAANEDVESEKSPLNSCSSALHKAKGKDLTSPLVAKEKLNMVAYTSSEQPENKLTDKKKRKSLKGDVLKWSIRSPQFNPQGQRNVKFINVVRSYHGKHMKVKQDFVTD
ncbi:phoenix isoform X1 [Larimichthys crocea]|uniref:phoenix isoform X1 n=1 Tax=Larimichthys crocea TaxID=215358 RepID=UPI000F5FEB28|nr:transcriptional regulator ATRX isoform X1 [Larimichthys crocea]